MHAAYVRPGGVALDLPVGLLEDVHQWATHFAGISCTLTVSLLFPCLFHLSILVSNIFFILSLSFR